MNLEAFWRLAVSVFAVPLALAAAAEHPAPATFDVHDFGAIGDGITEDTKAIQATINACSAAGGGRVTFGKGTYLSGSLELGNGVTLWLGPATTLLGSPNIDDYPTGHLIEADGVRAVGIEGRGTIDGQGPAFWDAEDSPKPRPAPWLDFRNCRDVSIRGVRLRNSPAHTLYLTRCRRVTVEGVDMATEYRGPNTDGIDINGSSEVFVRGCAISTGDDAICLKAREPDMVVENVIVSDCVLASDDSAIKLGTGSGGVMRHCVLSNIVIRNTRYGIAFFMKDGGVFHNIRLADLSIETGTRADRPRYEIPIFMDIESRTPETPLGRIRDVSISGADIVTRGGCLIAGQTGHPIENLELSDITMRVREPQDMRRQKKPRGTRSLTGPAPNDYSRVPAHLVIGHVKGLRMRDVRVMVDEAGGAVPRRALWATDLEDAVIDGFQGSAVGQGSPTISMVDGREVTIRASRAAPGTVTWLLLSGRRTEGVQLISNDTSHAAQLIVTGPNVHPFAVTME